MAVSACSFVWKDNVVQCISFKRFEIHSILLSDRCQLVTFCIFIIAETLTGLQVESHKQMAPHVCSFIWKDDVVQCISIKGFRICLILSSDRCQLVTFGAFIIVCTLTGYKINHTRNSCLWQSLFVCLWFNVFLLEDSGFVLSFQETDASWWLGLLSSISHQHLRGFKLNYTSKCCLWHPLFTHFFGRTTWLLNFYLRIWYFFDAPKWQMPPGFIIARTGQITQWWLAIIA